MKIFIGLREIAGYYTRLRNGFEELGIDASYINIYPNAFAYNEEEINFLVRLAKKTMLLRLNSNYLKRIYGYGLNLICRILLFVWALSKYDIFIFGFATSFLNLNDLQILKYFNKKIIFMFHGSDSRPPYSDGTFIQGSDLANEEMCYKSTKKMVKKLEIIEKYADFIINHPPQSFLLKNKFISANYIGIPFNVHAEINTQKKRGEKFTILHSPSNKIAKGTPFLESLVDELKEEGLDIEFIMLSGVRHDQVINMIQQSDIILDQAYSDTPLAGFGTEAAYFGKPVITGGYYAQYLEKIIPEEKYRPPSIFCHPNDIKKNLRELITNSEYLESTGKNLKIYVKDFLTPKKVAENFIRLIKNDFPVSWYVEPKKIDYFDVTGIDQKKGRAFLKSYYAKKGISAFFISDKPGLEKIVKDYINHD